MGRLVWTGNICFDMRDLKKESFRAVFTGTECVMALT